MCLLQPARPLQILYGLCFGGIPQVAAALLAVWNRILILHRALSDVSREAKIFTTKFMFVEVVGFRMSRCEHSLSRYRTAVPLHIAILNNSRQIQIFVREIWRAPQQRSRNNVSSPVKVTVKDRGQADLVVDPGLDNCG